MVTISDRHCIPLNQQSLRPEVSSFAVTAPCSSGARAISVCIWLRSGYLLTCWLRSERPRHTSIGRPNLLPHIGCLHVWRPRPWGGVKEYPKFAGKTVYRYIQILRTEERMSRNQKKFQTSYVEHPPTVFSWPQSQSRPLLHNPRVSPANREISTWYPIARLRLGFSDIMARFFAVLLHDHEWNGIVNSSISIFTHKKKYFF